MMFFEVIRDLKAQNLDNNSILAAMKQMVQEGKLSQNELDYAIEWLNNPTFKTQQQNQENNTNNSIDNQAQQQNPSKELTEQEQVNNLFGMKIL